MVKHRNIIYCLQKREHGILLLNERRALDRFGEDQTASRCNRTLECQLTGSARSTFLVAFSPDGRVVASAHGDHTVKIIDGKSGRCLRTLEGHPRTPWTITFHPSRPHLLASGCLGGEARVWDLNQHSCQSNSTVFRSPRATGITSLAFHPTDDVVLIATDNQLLFWNWDQPTPFACIDTASKEERVHLVRFHPLGHHILTGIRNRATALSNCLNEEIVGEHGINIPEASLQTVDRTSAHTTSQAHSGISISANAVLRHSLQRNINREIANSLAQRGNIAMASNILSTTYRLQCWDFTKFAMPKLQEAHSNVVVECCKLLNDASIDISADGRLLSSFVPSKTNLPVASKRLWEEWKVCVFSLEAQNLGDCLFSSRCRPNAISVSFSPLGRYLLVGLAWNPYGALSSAHKSLAHVLKFNAVQRQSGSSEDVSETMEVVSHLKYNYPTGEERTGLSINTVRWHPIIGSGLVYGTNKGGVRFCYIGSAPPSSAENHL